MRVFIYIFDLSGSLKTRVIYANYSRWVKLIQSPTAIFLLSKLV
jgi:hypothetical protein